MPNPALDGVWQTVSQHTLHSGLTIADSSCMMTRLDLKESREILYIDKGM